MTASVKGSLPKKRWFWAAVKKLFTCGTGIGRRRAVWTRYPLPRVVQILGIVKDKFVVAGLGESTVVIRDGEQLTSGGNPSLSWVDIELWLLLLLLLVFCLVSSLLLSLFLFLLLLLPDAGVFELEVSKCLLNIIGASVLQLNTDTSVYVALETVWGGVSALGSGTLGCASPQLRDSCKEGVDPL